MNKEQLLAAFKANPKAFKTRKLSKNRKPEYSRRGTRAQGKKPYSTWLHNLEPV